MPIPAPSAETKEQGYLTTEALVIDQDANQSAVATSGADDTKTQDAKKPATSLEAVQAAVKEIAEGQPSKPTEKAKEGSEAGETEGEKPKEEAGDKEADEAPPPFHKHPRWQEMVKQRETLTQENERLKPAADAFQVIQDYAQKHNLDGKEIEAGYNIMALMKSDPIAAKALLTPYWEALNEVTGAVVPADLKARVETGALAEEDAQEIARLRAAERVQTGRVENANRQLQTASHSTLINDMASTVTSWEKTQAATDPDFAKKQPLIADRIHAVIAQSGVPASTEQALQLAKDAKVHVEKMLKGMMPARPAVQNISAASSASVAATAQPKTSLEAAQIALRNMAVA